MAFLYGTDTPNAKVLGVGEAANGFDSHIYYKPFAAITNYDPADPASDWIRVKFVSDFQATEDTGELTVFDGRDTDHTIEGRKESSITIKQDYVSFHQSVEKLKGTKLYFVEAIGDSREAVDGTGKKIYSEFHLYEGKIAKISKDKPTDNIYSVTGEGKYNTKTAIKYFRKLTPMNIVLTPSGGATATISTPKSLSVVATDIYLAAVDLLPTNNEEVTSVQIVSVSGPSFTQAGTNAAPTITFGSAGTAVIKCKITTKNNFVAESGTVSITVS